MVIQFMKARIFCMLYLNNLKTIFKNQCKFCALFEKCVDAMLKKTGEI